METVEETDEFKIVVDLAADTIFLTVTRKSDSRIVLNLEGEPASDLLYNIVQGGRHHMTAAVVEAVNG